MQRFKCPAQPAPCVFLSGERLVLGSDGGGPRWFLAGQPVHAGTGLVLLLPGGWTLPVRFETGPRFEPYLYMTLGERVEPRFEIKAGGSFTIFDRQEGVVMGLEVLREMLGDMLDVDTNRWASAAQVSSVLMALEDRDRPQAVFLGRDAVLLWPKK